MPEATPSPVDGGPGRHGPGRFPLILIVEGDPGGLATSPHLLGRESAGRLAASLAADLMRLGLGLERFGLAMAGALYTVPELLRPGWPLLERLAELYRGSAPPGALEPRMLALGSDDAGGFPVRELNPGNAPGAGPLRVIPLLLTGDREALGSVAAILENRLMQDARLTDDNQALLESLFDCRFPNASFATLADLCGLVQMQFEAQGLDGLWTLIGQALFHPDENRTVQLPEGNRFTWREGAVSAPFLTFDRWIAASPGGRESGEARVHAYGDWTRLQRQYALGLQLHGIVLRQWLDTGSARRHPLRGPWMVETAGHWAGAGPARHMSITHQFLPVVGTVAYSVLVQDADGRAIELEHLYPLMPGAVDPLVATLRTRCEREGLTHSVRHPGTLVIHGERLWTEDAPPPRKAGASPGNEPALR